MCNLYDKKKCHTRKSQEAGARPWTIILERVHRVIEFDQEACLKHYMDINSELIAKTKNDFEKDFFKLMNNSWFLKTLENVTTDKRRNYLGSEPNYHTIKCFSDNLMAMEMNKINVKMNRPVYLGLSSLDISKITMYGYWHDHTKPKYGDNAKLCYMNADNLIFHVKSVDLYKDLAGDVEQDSKSQTMKSRDLQP